MANTSPAGTIEVVKGPLIQRWRTARVQRFFRYVGARIAYGDPAWPNYFTKLALSAQDSLYQAHRRLGERYSYAVVDRLFLAQAWRVRLARHGVRALDGALFVMVVRNELPLSGVVATFLLVGAARAGSNALDSTRAETFYRHVTSNRDSAFDAFSARIRRRALRQGRHHLPASTLLDHPHRALVLRALGLTTADLSETALALADEFDGTAYELLEAAAALERG